LKRPLSVAVLAWIYIVVGAASFAGGLKDFRFAPDDFLAAALRLLAVVAGVFLLRGCDWARWLALAWIAAHVAISAFHSYGELAAHCVFCGCIAWLLFRRDATRYFRQPG
jgi:hypothetical protein